MLPIGINEKRLLRTLPICGNEKCPGEAYPDHQQSQWSNRMVMIGADQYEKRLISHHSHRISS